MNIPRAKCGYTPPFLDEIIHEILSRLPVKSLSRFRCVCKSWNTKISTSKFIKLHLERSRQNPHLTLMSSNPQNNDFNLVPFPVHHFLENPLINVADDPYCRFKVDDCYKVIGSCNGLVCLLGCNCSLMFEEYWFYLWNPAMRLRNEKSVSFLINPESSVFKFAFGYDNSKDTYKVVAFCLEDEGSNSLQS
ncbi:F-box-like domain superfamily [Sesbania bispinosa]|nr:F-box-like domain superfamily [Sesbania bispinosa]